MSGMSRPIWTCTLSFGLVPIPVGVFASKEGNGTKNGLHEFHADDGGEIGYQKYCKKCQGTVGWKEPVKGEMIDGEKLLTYSQQELESVAPESSRELKIEAVIPRSPLLDVMVDSVYYLRPVSSKRSEKVPESTKIGFNLVRETLGHDRVAITKLCVRGKEHIGTVEAYGKGLVLRVLTFYGDVRWDDMVLSGEEDYVIVPDEYRQLGERLVAAMQKDEKVLAGYMNESAEKFASLRERKLAGLPVILPPTPVQREVPDLLKALKASIGIVGSGDDDDGKVKKTEEVED